MRFNVQHNAIERVRQNLKGDGRHLRTASSAQPDKGHESIILTQSDGEEYRERAMLELLHSDRFMPQFENITGVFDGPCQETPMLVPVELLQAVESREAAARAKLTAFQHLNKLQCAKYDDSESRVKSLSSQLQLLTKDKEVHQRKIKTLTATVEADKSLISDQQEQLNISDEQLSFIKEELRRSEALIGHTKQRVESLEHEIKQLTERCLTSESAVIDRGVKIKNLQESLQGKELQLKISANSIQQQNAQIKLLNFEIKEAHLESKLRAPANAANGNANYQLLVKEFHSEKRENIKMEQHDCDVQRCKEAFTAVRYDRSSVIHRQLQSNITVIPITRKTTPLDGEISVVHQFVQKHGSNGNFSKKQLQPLLEMATASSTCLTSLEGMIKDLSLCVEQDTLTGIEKILGITLKLTMDTLSRLLPVKRYCKSTMTTQSTSGTPVGIQCNVIMQSTQEVQATITTKTVSLNTDDTPSLSCDAVDEIAKSLSKRTRELMLSSGIRQQTIPHGIRLDSRKVGVPLVKACINALGTVKVKLDEILREGKSYETQANTMMADNVSKIVDNTAEVQEMRKQRPFGKRLQKLMHQVEGDQEQSFYEGDSITEGSVSSADIPILQMTSADDCVLPELPTQTAIVQQSSELSPHPPTTSSLRRVTKDVMVRQKIGFPSGKTSIEVPSTRPDDSRSTAVTKRKVLGRLGVGKAVR